MDDPLPSLQLLPTTLSLIKLTTPQNQSLTQKMIVLSLLNLLQTLLSSLFVLSTEPLNVENPSTQDVQDKNDENPQDAPASLP